MTTAAAIPSCPAIGCIQLRSPHATRLQARCRQSICRPPRMFFGTCPGCRPIVNRTTLQMSCAPPSQAFVPSEEDRPMVAVEGDIVTVHFVCKDSDGTVIQSTKDDGAPVSFEIGVGDVTGNSLFQAFDAVVRGTAPGQTSVLEAAGPEWKPELYFEVPRDHPEIERLEGRYKNQGGLREGLVVELANGAMAVVVQTTPENVRLDANGMMAGKSLTFEVELVSIERGR